MIYTFLLLIFLHYLGDYPLQGDFLAKAKNRTAPIPGVPWYQALGAHATIHGGLVTLATGNIVLGILETVIHAITDDLKCRSKLTFNQDQAIHIICKMLWVVLLG
jgi:type IV secretory pathway VirB3-like protein